MLTMEPARGSRVEPPPAREWTILIVDNSKISREKVSKGLGGEGFTIISANDGDSGLAQIARQTPDLVLLDHAMPRINGLAFLKTLRAQKRWANLPVIMLTNTTSKDVIVEAVRYKISGWVLKERMSLSELLSRIRGALNQADRQKSDANSIVADDQKAQPGGGGARSELLSDSSATGPTLVSRETTLAAISELGAAKLFVGVIKQVEAISTSAKASAAGLASIVRQDPVLSARAIQLASSSGYAGGKSKLCSVEDAVRIVGVTGICELAVKIGVFQAFASGKSDATDLLRCWHHAFAVAAIMSRIVPRTDSVTSGLAHLVGICHDLPEIVLRQAFPAEFATAVKYAADAAVPPTAMVASVFGVSYAELTRLLFEKLQFPAIISDPINEFFQFGIGAGMESYKSLLSRALFVADVMADGMLLTCSADSVVSPVALVHCRSALIPSTPLNVAEIRSEAITSVSMFTDLSEEQARALSMPLVARSDAKVLYVRQAGLAPLDPLEVALKNIADVEVKDKVPGADELSAYAGMIVAAVSPNDPIFFTASKNKSLMAKPIPLVTLAGFNDGARHGIVAGTDTPCGYPVSVKDLAQFVATLKPSPGLPR